MTTSGAAPFPGRAEPERLAISVAGLSFAYGGGPAVIRGLDFECREGEKVSIIGPSGCGKSSLLSLMAGLVAPTSGTVRTVAPRAAGQLGISMMFQKETLLPWLTVLDNVTLASRLSPRRRRDDAGAIELIEMVGLAGAIDRYPYQLSGGMRRRVQLLCAVYSRPRILLLDEPFSALDEPTRIGVHADVLRIVDELDITLLLVTHDLAEAITLADRVVIMSTPPSSVASVHSTDLGAGRDIATVRQAPGYQRLYGQIWQELSEQTRASSAPRRGT